MGCEAEELGFDSLAGKEIFLFSVTSRPVLGPIRLVYNEYQVIHSRE
jgi:hypothetical protein